MSSVLFSDVGTKDPEQMNDSYNYDSSNDNFGMTDNVCNLSIKVRIIGALICIVIGIVLNSIAMGFLFTFQLKNFSIIYVFGTISSIGSSFFIAGPQKHIQALKFKPHLIAGIILIALIIMIFIFACGLKIGIIALIFVIAEVIDMLIFNLTLHEKMWEKVKKLFFKCIMCFKKNKNDNTYSDSSNNNIQFQDTNDNISNIM